jgi:hypothetical protein
MGVAPLFISIIQGFFSPFKKATSTEIFVINITGDVLHRFSNATQLWGNLNIS